jgi:hypothetical protein
MEQFGLFFLAAFCISLGAFLLLARARYLTIFVRPSSILWLAAAIAGAGWWLHVGIGG